AMSVISPLSGAGWNTAIATPASASLGPRQRMSWVNAVSPGWFATYGIHLAGGRDIDAGDRQGAPPVAIVNRAFASRFFHGEDPVGREFALDEPRGGPRTYQVIGLAENAVYLSMRSEMPPTMYIPIAQAEQLGARMAFGIRAASGTPTALIRSLTDAIGGVDPRAGITFRSMSDQVAGTLTQ